MDENKWNELWERFVTKHGPLLEDMKKASEEMLSEGDGDSLMIWDLALGEHRKQIFQWASRMQLVISRSKLTLGDVLKQ